MHPGKFGGAPASAPAQNRRRKSRFIVNIMTPDTAKKSEPARAMYKGQSITVIIPCLNEEQGIEKVLRGLPEFVDEIIVVDNGSTDRTAEWRDRWAPK